MNRERTESDGLEIYGKKKPLKLSVEVFIDIFWGVLDSNTGVYWTQMQDVMNGSRNIDVKLVRTV